MVNWFYQGHGNSFVACLGVLVVFRTIVALTVTAALLCACGGGGSSNSGPTNQQIPPETQAAPTLMRISSETEAYRLLTWGTFGASPGAAAALVGTDASDWVQNEFGRQATTYLPRLRARARGGEILDNRAHTDLFWNAAIGGSDQLRQRVVFALSQIIVVSDRNMSFSAALPMAQYMDVLSLNAFGNYRDILKEVTYTPAMADFLTYLRNRKPDPASGRMPDENYARELMQLFSIGLVELLPNGDIKLGPNGREIETYTNDDVVGLARVFTGMSMIGPSFWEASPEGTYSRLTFYPEFHTLEEKEFLGLFIPPGTNGPDSLDMALDHLFNHPNMGPFVARQLIQRMTQSHPEASYIQRVAEAFDAGRFVADDGTIFGGGERGDMKAVIAAILLEPSLWNDSAGLAPSDGKIREPLLLLTNWARAFDAAPVAAFNEARLRDTGDFTRALAQDPFGAPSVFNFYRPGYVSPGTNTGESSLTAPEFQIMNEGSFAGIDNTLHRFATETTGRIDTSISSFSPDYSRAVVFAADATILVNNLDMLLTGGRLRPESRDRIIAAAEVITLRAGTEELDRLDRVKLVVLMIVSSPAYAVIY